MQVTAVHQQLLEIKIGIKPYWVGIDFTHFLCLPAHKGHQELVKHHALTCTSFDGFEIVKRPNSTGKVMFTQKETEPFAPCINKFLR